MERRISSHVFRAVGTNFRLLLRKQRSDATTLSKVFCPPKVATPESDESQGLRHPKATTYKSLLWDVYDTGKVFDGPDENTRPYPAAFSDDTVIKLSLSLYDEQRNSKHPLHLNSHYMRAFSTQNLEQH